MPDVTTYSSHRFSLGTWLTAAWEALQYLGEIWSASRVSSVMLALSGDGGDRAATRFARSRMGHAPELVTLTPLARCVKPAGFCSVVPQNAKAGLGPRSIRGGVSH